MPSKSLQGIECALKGIDFSEDVIPKVLRPGDKIVTYARRIDPQRPGNCALGEYDTNARHRDRPIGNAHAINGAEAKLSRLPSRRHHPGWLLHLLAGLPDGPASPRIPVLMHPYI